MTMSDYSDNIDYGWHILENITRIHIAGTQELGEIERCQQIRNKLMEVVKEYSHGCFSVCKLEAELGWIRNS